MPLYNPTPNFYRTLAVSDEKRIGLVSGAAHLLPRGWISIIDMGPFLTLLKYSVQRQCWVPARPQRGVISPLLYSTGSNYRIVNNVNCAMSAKITAVGSGYSSLTPPVVVTTRASTNGPTTTLAQFRAIVGGAITLSITGGGQYKYPPIITFDYSQQVAPFRPATIEPRLNSSGVIIGFNYDGNDNPTQSGSTSGPGGAGLNAATLGVTVVRHPDDPFSSDAVLTIVAAGSGTVTAIDCTDFGGPVGDFDFQNTTSITHNGGSGLTFAIAGNFYVTGITVNSGGNYGSDASSGGLNYVDLHLFDGMLDDEESRPITGAGIGILAAGAVTSASFSGGGPGWQTRPKVASSYQGATPPVTNALFTSVLGKGGDYVTYQVLSQ